MSEEQLTQEARLVLDLENLLRHESGRRFIWEYLSFCGVHSSTFDADPITHAYNAGVREAGLHFETVLKTNAYGFYMTMMRENNK